MCTGIRLKSKNGAVVCGRTLEFGSDIQSKILMIPRKHTFSGITSTGGQGLPWSSRYAVVGANMLNMTEIADGVNEKGLAAGLFYFPEYAQYQEVVAGDITKSIAPWQLVTWILTQCATIDEVKKELPNIKVGNVIYAPWKMVPPIHVIVHDATGKSLVIEYLEGNLVMRDNPLGVITNSPSFDWHTTNLRNYVNLSALNVPKVALSDVAISSFGQGSGMLGLPGDFTPPSRFVRAVAFSQSVIELNDAHQARRTAFHILNLFDIPKGVVRQKEDRAIHYDYTQWTSVTDLNARRYYWRTYDNHRIYSVDLMSMDMDGADPVMIPMQRDEMIENVVGE